jgi:hypothetical protein
MVGGVKLRDEYRITLYVVGGCFVLSMLLGFVRGNPGGNTYLNCPE